MPKEIRGKRLYQDESFVLLKQFPLSTRVWIAGGFFVGVPGVGIVAKATVREKLFLLGVLGEFARRGISPTDERAEELYLRFCEAVATRGGIRWQLFFRSRTTMDAAAEYLAG